MNNQTGLEEISVDDLPVIEKISGGNKYYIIIGAYMKIDGKLYKTKQSDEIFRSAIKEYMT